MDKNLVIEFKITPFKLILSLLIQILIKFKVNSVKKEFGQFANLIYNLLQNSEMSYHDLIKYIRKFGIREDLIEDFQENVKMLEEEGVRSIIDLITDIKYLQWVNKASIVGLFTRKMFLFFDKLSFMEVTKLYEEFVKYISQDKMNVRSQDKPSNGRILNPIKQAVLLQVNEKQALSPKNLLKLLKYHQSDYAQNPIVFKNHFRKINNQNVNYFLHYLNSLRINEYPGALQFLLAYFDGCIDQESRCWAALNLAMLHIHFNHNRLAMEAVKECISAAQESNDEKCLEFAFLLIAKIIINQREKDSQDEDILRFLYHLQTKATKLDLHYLSAIAALHFEKIIGLGSDLKGDKKTSDISPDLLAVEHSMPDVLMMTYACKSAHYAAIGATHLTALTSQALLHLNFNKQVGDQIVDRVNENTCIAIRNLALHLWRNLGEYSLARDMLIFFAADLFSFYQTNITKIWKQALAEIEFEYHFYRADWTLCLNSISDLKLYDEIEANIRLIELNLRRKLKQEAFVLVCTMLDQDAKESNLSVYTRIRIILLKAKILKDFSSLFEALELAKKYHFGQLETSCILGLAKFEYKLGQRSKSLSLLRRVFISILCNSTRSEVAFAYYLQALNYRANGDLDLALSSNQTALSISIQLEDKHFLKKCYKLNALIFNEKQNFEKRNFYSLQYRKLILS